MSEKQKILIVAEDSSIRNLLFVSMAGLGCAVEVALDGPHAVSMVRRESFDALVLGVRRVGRDQESIIAEIRKVRPELAGKIVVICRPGTDPKTKTQDSKTESLLVRPIVAPDRP
jgi:two-component system response regulator MprA